MVSKKMFVAFSLVLGLALVAGCKQKVEEAPTPEAAPAAQPEVAPPPPPPPPAIPKTLPQGTPAAAPAASPSGTPAATPEPEPFENKVLDVPDKPAKVPGEVIEVAP